MLTRLFALSLAIVFYGIGINAGEPPARLGVGDTVTIVIRGDLLSDYLQATGDPKEPDELEKILFRTTDATVTFITDDGSYAIQHRVHLQNEGKTPQLIVLNAIVHPRQMSIKSSPEKRRWSRETPSNKAGESEPSITQTRRYRIDLAKIDKVWLRTWSLETEIEY